ncbi:tetraacyldisaccharide 4'-kinase [Pseudorhodoplanes sp.]|uniref:tetraacyldisaccharide 4'-kinase n=1 Tax=Pseudorhodoplanes sp. TaxID=1934341 RepID=UPI00391B1912
MREPDFWWRPPGVAARLLAPVGFLYGAIAAWRMRRRGHRGGIPVICIGNFTLGGTGKTPTAIAVAKLLAARGERPVFLTRGYGGRLAGPVTVDPSRHRAADVGDEPLLLARHGPTVVSRDRSAGADFAKTAGATVIVMDDGLQNPSLHKDVSIAVVDARRGLGNACVFPAGPLRAPLAPQLACVQAVVLIGEGASPVTELARKHGLPLMRARLAPADSVKVLQGRRVLAFAGIGDPEKFFATLAAAGIDAPVREGFPDHHVYTDSEAEHILARCAAEHLTPVTTEKDLARLAGRDGACGRLAAAAQAIPVSLVVEQAQTLRNLLEGMLSADQRC